MRLRILVLAAAALCAAPVAAPRTALKASAQTYTQAQALAARQAAEIDWYAAVDLQVDAYYGWWNAKQYHADVLDFVVNMTGVDPSTYANWCTALAMADATRVTAQDDWGIGYTDYLSAVSDMNYATAAYYWYPPDYTTSYTYAVSASTKFSAAMTKFTLSISESEQAHNEIRRVAVACGYEGN